MKDNLQLLTYFVDKILNVWRNTLFIEDSLDGDDVELFIDFIRIYVNLKEGNLTNAEHSKLYKKLKDEYERRYIRK